MEGGGLSCFYQRKSHNLINWGGLSTYNIDTLSLVMGEVSTLFMLHTQPEFFNNNNKWYLSSLMTVIFSFHIYLI